MSTVVPGVSPSASRSGLGTTMRPTASIVVSIGKSVPVESQTRDTQEIGEEAPLRASSPGNWSLPVLEAARVVERRRHLVGRDVQLRGKGVDERLALGLPLGLLIGAGGIHRRG